MAFKRKTFRSGVTIFFIILTLLLLKFFYPTSSRLSISPAQKDPLERLVEKQSLNINDSLPHREYKRKLDSIRRTLFDQLPTNGSSLGVFNFSAEERGKDENYYLNVGGYFAKENFDFYSLHKKNYIEYPGILRDANGTSFEGLRTDTITTRLQQLNQSEWQIGYPISKTAYHIWEGIVVLLMLISGAAFFYGIVGLPLRLMFLIAKGQAFTEEAISRLHTIAFIILFAGGFESLFRLLFHLYFKSAMPAPITFYYYDDLMSGSTLIIIGLIVLLFAKAFQRGYELQQEQELTV